MNYKVKTTTEETHHISGVGSVFTEGGVIYFLSPGIERDVVFAVTVAHFISAEKVSDEPDA